MIFSDWKKKKKKIWKSIFSNTRLNYCTYHPNRSTARYKNWFPGYGFALKSFIPSANTANTSYLKFVLLCIAMLGLVSLISYHYNTSTFLQQKPFSNITSIDEKSNMDFSQQVRAIEYSNTSEISRPQEISIE